MTSDPQEIAAATYCRLAMTAWGITEGAEFFAPCHREEVKRRSDLVFSCPPLARPSGREPQRMQGMLEGLKGVEFFCQK